jgi:lysophospholipase L1-like esterase
MRRTTTALVLATAGILTWSGDARAQPAEHYAQRVATFEARNRELPADRRHVVLVGDSLTEGFEGRNTQRHLPTLKDRVLNRGIASDRVGAPRGVLSRLGPSIFDCQPSHVFLLVGVNQIGRDGSGIAGAVRHYGQILERVAQRLPEVKVFVVTTTPARGRYAGFKDAILRYNRRLADLAKARGLPVIDLHAAMVGEDGLLRPELTRDGLHYTSAGYAIYGRLIEAAVAADEASDPSGVDGDGATGREGSPASESAGGGPRAAGGAGSRLADLLD